MRRVAKRDGLSDRGEWGRAAVVKIVALKAHVRARRKGMALFFGSPAAAFKTYADMGKKINGKGFCELKYGRWG